MVSMQTGSALLCNWVILLVKMLIYIIYSACSYIVLEPKVSCNVVVYRSDIHRPYLLIYLLFD